jgi:hypothetical protein
MPANRRHDPKKLRHSIYACVAANWEGMRIERLSDCPVKPVLASALIDCRFGDIQGMTIRD